jgi:hypothetical protein
MLHICKIRHGELKLDTYYWMNELLFQTRSDRLRSPFKLSFNSTETYVMMNKSVIPNLVYRYIWIHGILVTPFCFCMCCIYIIYIYTHIYGNMYVYEFHNITWYTLNIHNNIYFKLNIDVETFVEWCVNIYFSWCVYV